MIDFYTDHEQRNRAANFIYQNWTSEDKIQWNKLILKDGRSVQKVYADGQLVWPREYPVSASFLSVCRPFKYIGKYWEFCHQYASSWSTPYEFQYTKVVCHGSATGILIPTISTRYGYKHVIRSVFFSSEPNQVIDYTSGLKLWGGNASYSTTSIELNRKYSANGKAVYYYCNYFYTRYSFYGKFTLNGEPFDFTPETCGVVSDNNYLVYAYAPQLAWLYLYKRMPEEVETIVNMDDISGREGP